MLPDQCYTFLSATFPIYDKFQFEKLAQHKNYNLFQNNIKLTVCVGLLVWVWNESSMLTTTRQLRCTLAQGSVCEGIQNSPEIELKFRPHALYDFIFAPHVSRTGVHWCVHQFWGKAKPCRFWGDLSFGHCPQSKVLNPLREHSIKFRHKLTTSQLGKRASSVAKIT